MDDLSDIYREIDEDFRDYHECFLIDEDPAIGKLMTLKYEHSLRVAGNCGRLAQALGLGAREATLARVAGLLHDIGRFEQLRDYGTFDDALSGDHGLLGREALANTGFLEPFATPEQLAVLAAVAAHNRRSPDETFPDPLSRELAHLVRDADKLDRLRIVAGKLADPAAADALAARFATKSDGDEPPRPADIAPGLACDIRALRPAGRFAARTLAEFLLSQASWTLGFHHPAAHALASADGHLAQILDAVPASETASELITAIKQHNEQKSKNLNPQQP